jgi:alpha-1,2-mannosyltransferase
MSQPAGKGPKMARLRDSLRSGDWLTRERVNLVATALLIASAAGFLFLVVTAHDSAGHGSAGHGIVDRQDRPLGTDFSNVYAAGTYVRDGNAAAAFDPPRQFEREQEIFGPTTQFYGWHYPPFFLFIATALAWMPYGVALAVWQTVTLALYVLMIGAIIIPSFRGARSTNPESIVPAFAGSDPNSGSRKSWPWIPDNGFAASGMTKDWLLLALAFPAVLINVGHGQNGFLTAALLGGALVVLDRRPILAGILFGLLVYKPQYGLLIPLVLALSSRWRCFASAALTVVLLTLVTTLVFGMGVWHAFFASTEFTRTVVLEQGNTGWYKIQSVFAWARMWGAPIPLAYALQGATLLAIGAALVWLWRSAAPDALKAAALCLAAILATPYSFDYDMTVLAPAIAFIAADGFARGFGPWEKTTLAALWLVPLVARNIAHISLIPLGVPAMLAAFALILHRAGFGLSAAFSGTCAAEAIPEQAANQVAAEPQTTNGAVPGLVGD